MLLTALMAGLALGAPQSVKPGNHFTEVNGTRYRVAVRGETFAVFKKALVTKDTIEERDAQRQAVRQATGCEPIDELARDARLRGKLNCAR